MELMKMNDPKEQKCDLDWVRKHEGAHFNQDAE
jgi:hypothetical protein